MKNAVKYDDYKEKIVTAILGAFGTIAIFTNLCLKGGGWINFLDAIKDFAGLVVVLIVFLMTIRLFDKGKKESLAEIFESKLRAWAEQNRFLVSIEDKPAAGQIVSVLDRGQQIETDQTNKKLSKYDKKRCMMILDHSNVVTEDAIVSGAKENLKAVFMFLDDLASNEFEFRFNDTTFDRIQAPAYRKEDGKVDLTKIIGRLNTKLTEFKREDFQFETFLKPKDAITISFRGVSGSEQNAQRLIEIVEFVKTMILALA